jgi:hypothetical protein
VKYAKGLGIAILTTVSKLDQETYVAVENRRSVICMYTVEAGTSKAIVSFVLVPCRGLSIPIIVDAVMKG